MSEGVGLLKVELLPVVSILKKVCHGDKCFFWMCQIHVDGKACRPVGWDGTVIQRIMPLFVCVIHQSSLI